jgi:hypothetical protein
MSKNKAKKLLQDLEEKEIQTMGNTKIRVVLGTLVAVAALMALRATFPSGTLPKVHAQEEAKEGCSLETLEGRYGLTFSGLTTRGAVPAPIDAFIPVIGGGLVTFDGEGHLSAAETVSVGGQISPVNVSGTYTVNPDCTGSFATSHAHLNLVIVRDGKEILAVNEDQGNAVLDNFTKE